MNKLDWERRMSMTASNAPGFVQLSKYALVFCVSEWFLLVLAIAALSLFHARRAQRPLKSRLWKRHHWWVLTHLLFFPAAIAVGVLFKSPGGNHPNRSGVLILEILFFASLASGGAWTWRMGAFRWFGISLIGLMELPVLGALLAAALSVSPIVVS